MATQIITRICSVENCDCKHHANGYCAFHNARVTRKGAQADLAKPRRPKKNPPPKHIGCKVDGCPNKHQGLGYCDKHFRRFKKYGNTDTVLTSSEGLRGTDFQKWFFSQCSNTDKPDECWEWQGCRGPQGYGELKIHSNTKRAHRTAWQLNAGREPLEGLLILHHCDNPPCCNPSHLYEGTHQNNSDDMKMRDRYNPAIGERNGQAKLTEDKVRYIKQQLKKGTPVFIISDKVEISQSVVFSIRRGNTWKHIEVV